MLDLNDPWTLLYIHIVIGILTGLTYSLGVNDFIKSNRDHIGNDLAKARYINKFSDILIGGLGFIIIWPIAVIGGFVYLCLNERGY